MNPSEDPGLIDIAQRVADGERIDWAALLASRPDLATSLHTLRKLQALSDVCKHGTPSARSGRKTKKADRSVSASWGRLALREKIGEGSFGEVYRAFDKILQRDVALKLRRPLREGELTSYRRHLEEARLLARVRHPAVLTIHGVEVHDGRPGLWTDFISGVTLESAIAVSAQDPGSGATTRGVGLPANEIVRIGVAVAQGLGAVHDAGLVHGDVKTTNVMRQFDGRIVLMDFGAGRTLESIRSGVKDGAAGAEGTPVAMAPELLRGDPPNVRSDLYAVGVLLYRIATGRNPIEARDLVDLIERVETTVPIPVHELRPDVPRALVSVIERLLSRDPAERPGSAAEVEAELSIAFDLPLQERPGERSQDHLPRPQQTFIGRRNELLAIVQALRQSRLITLHGAGGVGKTRLAIEAARRTSGFVRAPWCWLDLTDLPAASNAEVIAREIVRKLEVAPLPHETTLNAAIRALGATPRMLVVDNAEHLVEGCRDVVRSLLDNCPVLHILVTSRLPLGEPEETCIALGTLPCLPSAEESACMASTAIEYDAVRLFVDRAHRQQPGFVLTNENAPAVAAICRLVDGLPFALELAAARLRGLGTAELARRLELNLQLVLSRHEPQTAARHETLRACIAWSYELLEPPQRVLLSRLSVFRGGWTLAAAEAVCSEPVEADAPVESDADPRSEPSRHTSEIVDRIQSLVENSLVVFDNASAEAAGDRYRLLESVREFASEGLGEPAEPALRLRHLRYFREFAENAEKHFFGKERVTWVTRVREEHENFEHALRTEATDRDSVEDAIRTAASLGRYWVEGGLVRTGLETCERVLDRPEGRFPTKPRAALLTWFGNLLEKSTNYPSAVRAHEESRDISESVGDRRSVAVALSNIANSEYYLGELVRCRDHASESYRIMEELGDRRGMAFSLNTMGRAEQALEQHDSAILLLERSHTLQRELGDGLGAALALHNKAVSLFALDRYDDAEPAVLQALAIRRSHAYTFGVASTLNLMASVYLGRSDLDQAERCVRECLTLRRDLQFTQGIVEVMDKFALISFERGDLVKASVILGMIDGQRKRLGIPAPPRNQRAMRILEDDVRSGLGDARHEAENERGRLMGLEQAVDFLLDGAETLT